MAAEPEETALACPVVSFLCCVLMLQIWGLCWWPWRNWPYSSQRPCWSVTFKGTPTDSELTHQAHLLLTLHTTGHCAPALITQVQENRDSSYSWKLTEMPQGHPLLQVPSQLLSLFHGTSIGGPVHSCLTLSAPLLILNFLYVGRG